MSIKTANNTSDMLQFIPTCDMVGHGVMARHDSTFLIRLQGFERVKSTVQQWPWARSCLG